MGRTSIIRENTLQRLTSRASRYPRAGVPVETTLAMHEAPTNARRYFPNQNKIQRSIVHTKTERMSRTPQITHSYTNTAYYPPSSSFALPMTLVGDTRMP